MFAALPGRTKDELEPILGKRFMGYASGNFSDFERHNQRGSTATDYNEVDQNDEIHRVMIEVEPLLEMSGKPNLRSIMLTLDEFIVPLFATSMVNSDGSEENMGQKTTDTMVQSQHDCLFARVCQEAYVKAQQNVPFVSDGSRIGSF